MLDIRSHVSHVVREHKIDTLVVFGLVTRACVLNTVMSAFNHGQVDLCRSLISLMFKYGQVPSVPH